MQCAGCGHTLSESGSSVCLRCGTPVPREYAMAAAPRQATVLRPDPVLPSGDNWQVSAPTGPYSSGSYRPAPPPPPTLYQSESYPNIPYPPTEKSRWRSTPKLVIIGLAMLTLIAGAFGTYRAIAGGLWAHKSPVTSQGDLGGSQTTAVNPHCALPEVDRAASQNLQNAELAAQLRDISKKDYTPIEPATLFHVGTTIYFAFTIATNNSGKLTADWCWGARGEKTSFQLSVSNNKNIMGYFSLQNLDQTAIGNGVIVVRWDGSVASTKTFSVIK